MASPLKVLQIRSVFFGALVTAPGEGGRLAPRTMNKLEGAADAIEDAERGAAHRGRELRDQAVGPKELQLTWTCGLCGGRTRI